MQGTLTMRVQLKTASTTCIGARGLLPLPGTPTQVTAVDINGALLKCP
jgi:hypothetical protein